MKHEKKIPEIGTKVTLYYYTGSETPYTVIGYEKGALLIQECSLYFEGERYFDTVADYIEPNPNGRIRKLHFCPSSGAWRDGEGTFAIFGSWNHEPYTN